MTTDPGVALPPPRGCTNLKLKQASRLVARHYESFLAGAGLKNTQYSLLSHVVTLGPLRAGELAAAMRLDASTLTRNLQPLLDKGWLQMHIGEADARSRVVEATAAGQALRQQGQKAWKRAQLALNHKLGPDRVAALHALLDECLPLLGNDEADGSAAAPAASTGRSIRSSA